MNIPIKEKNTQADGAPVNPIRGDSLNLRAQDSLVELSVGLRPFWRPIP